MRNIVLYSVGTPLQSGIISFNTVKEEKEKPSYSDIYLIIWGPYCIATDFLLVSGLKKYTAFLRYVT